MRPKNKTKTERVTAQQLKMPVLMSAAIGVVLAVNLRTDVLKPIHQDDQNLVSGLYRFSTFHHLFTAHRQIQALNSSH